MGISVAVNPPKTPVTEGSGDVAAATLPNVCKMPGPPAPFVPTPLPNVGKSSDRLTNGTKTVKIEGSKIAIKGAYYMSAPSPDVASQGTGGGILSSCVQGKTEFTAPGSMNVKAEGKNIQLLGDAMTNNGSSKNTGATLPGNVQVSAAVANVKDALCKEFCAELARGGTRSYDLEQRLGDDPRFSAMGVRFAPYTAVEHIFRGVVRTTIPDAALYVAGELIRCFDFKFPGDRWRGDQYERQTRLARRVPTEISKSECGC